LIIADRALSNVNMPSSLRLRSVFNTISYTSAWLMTFAACEICADQIPWNIATWLDQEHLVMFYLDNCPSQALDMSCEVTKLDCCPTSSATILGWWEQMVELYAPFRIARGRVDQCAHINISPRFPRQLENVRDYNVSRQRTPFGCVLDGDNDNCLPIPSPSCIGNGDSPLESKESADFPIITSCPTFSALSASSGSHSARLGWDILTNEDLGPYGKWHKHNLYQFPRLCAPDP
jgi:hypothetical protein